MINKQFVLAALFLFCGGMTFGQVPYGPSDPSAPIDCGVYQWPEVQSPCPEAQVMQKHNHTPKPQYRQYGWDTVFDCRVRDSVGSITLSCMPYIPVQYFTGQYTVDQIPYNPPDTTFALGQRMPIGVDDEFAGSHTIIPYPFYFFGIKKDQFRIGANGLVTFCSPTDFGSGNSCPYAFQSTNQLPWNGSSGHTDPFNMARMRDAIYGVMEDTHPGHFVGSETNRVDGIYYGIQDVFPCRKIICSWKEAPNYNDYSHKGTYQIVCYEGSNIIEVHVKQRRCCPTTSDALIGIQNATGQPQVKSNNSSDPNFLVQNGSPAAFYPTGYNVFTSDLDTIAFRFTPQGRTAFSYSWYRIFDDGRDSIVLPREDLDPNAQNDTNGYVIPMGEASVTCPTLSLAVIRPTMPSKYVYELRFRNANGDEYILADTVFVGVDTTSDLSLVKSESGGDPHVYEICQGRTANMSLTMTNLQDTSSTEWHIYREHNGEQTEFENPRSLLSFGAISTIDTVKTIPISLNTNALPALGVRNKIDSVYIRGIVDFTSGCHNNDLILIRIFPNFDTTDFDGICRSETYTWEPSDTKGHSYHFTYTDAQYPATTYVGGDSEYPLQSVPGCDSLVRLSLAISDTSHTTDFINDCKPIVWLDSNTYDHDNSSATVVLKNRFDCDSIVHLHFTLYPLTARLHSNVDHFSFDNLDAELTDISTNSNSRVWKLPAMADQTGVTAYYSIPVEMDGAEILLIASSEYGCIDTASIYIPLNKENFWIPNIFTPDNPNGNNRFGSISSKTVFQEMLIYNRRGELVFRCNEPDCTWDGRDLNGNPCVQDAYVYIIRYSNEFNPKETKVLKGTVTLLR